MMLVPNEVRDALAGHPAVGEWDPMFPLLTVDDVGFPDVCLLGRAELDANSQHIDAVIVGSTTTANLQRDGRATLVVFGAETATYCKLRAVGAPICDGPWSGFTFEVVAVKQDSADVAMEPSKFLPTHRLSTVEHWDTSRRLLRQLSRERP